MATGLSHFEHCLPRFVRLYVQKRAQLRQVLVINIHFIDMPFQSLDFRLELPLLILQLINPFNVQPALLLQNVDRENEHVFGVRAPLLFLGDVFDLQQDLLEGFLALEEATEDEVR